MLEVNRKFNCVFWRQAIVRKLITGAADNHFPSLNPRRVALSQEQKELSGIRADGVKATRFLDFSEIFVL